MKLLHSEPALFFVASTSSLPYVVRTSTFLFFRITDLRTIPPCHSELKPLRSEHALTFVASASPLPSVVSDFYISLFLITDLHVILPHHSELKHLHSEHAARPLDHRHRIPPPFRRT